MLGHEETTTIPSRLLLFFPKQTGVITPNKLLDSFRKIFRLQPVLQTILSGIQIPSVSTTPFSIQDLSYRGFQSLSPFLERKITVVFRPTL